MSEILDRADELRALASQCKTLTEFWRRTGWADVQSAHAANTILSLNLPILSPKRTGKPRPAQECLKPGKKK